LGGRKKLKAEGQEKKRRKGGQDKRKNEEKKGGGDRITRRDLQAAFPGVR
jgi:hypothetical protein